MAAYDRAKHFGEVMDEIPYDWDPDLREKLVLDFGLVQRAYVMHSEKGPRCDFPYYRGVIRMLLARRGQDLDTLPWGKLKSPALQFQFEKQWKQLCDEEPELARCTDGQ